MLAAASSSFPRAASAAAAARRSLRISTPSPAAVVRSLPFSSSASTSSLEDKTVLILGSSGALGSSLAAGLSSRGATIVGADVVPPPAASNEDALGAFVPLANPEFGGGGGGGLGELCGGLVDGLAGLEYDGDDKSSSDSDSDSDSDSSDERGCGLRLDGILIASGGFAMDPDAGCPPSDYAETAERMMRMNYWPVLAGAVAAGRFMGGEGLFVAIGAAAALDPTPGMAAYGASKAAVHHYIQTLGATTGLAMGNKARRKRNVRERGRAEYLDDMTACAVLPTVLDTAANREAFPPDTDYEGWVKPADVASELGMWIERPHLRPHSGSLIKVSAKRGRAAEEARMAGDGGRAFFTLVR